MEERRVSNASGRHDEGLSPGGIWVERQRVAGRGVEIPFADDLPRGHPIVLDSTGGPTRLYTSAYEADELLCRMALELLDRVCERDFTGVLGGSHMQFSGGAREATQHYLD